MRIGLIDLEPRVVNTALMQVSFHHRSLGDVVEWAAPLCYGGYDRLYCSSLFTFTDKSQVPARAICGGTGFDLVAELGFDCDYDYSIYPECDYSIVWFSRGCIRKCPFCVVWRKEGGVRAVGPKPLNPKGGHIVVQDNNFFTNPEWHMAVADIIIWGQPVVFQGIDVRGLEQNQISALSRLKHHGQIKIAWDNPRENLIPDIERLLATVKAWRVMCYVLIGYWSTPAEDLRRVLSLQKLGVDPFVMPYDKADPYQKRFARWVNRPEIFNTVKWEDYT